MKTTITPKVKAMSWLLTLVYFASYMMRINFAVMIAKVCTDMQMEKSVLAIVLTGLTIAYGTGQVVSGVLGDRIKPRTMIIMGLTLATVCNIAMFFCRTVPLMTVAWTVNGFAHSMLWPPMVRLMSASLDDEGYSYAVVRVSWGSSIATILLYSLCPLLLGFMTWRAIIASCAAVGAVALVSWVIFSKKLFVDVKKTEAVAETAKTVEETAKTVERAPIPRYVILPIVLIMLGIIFQGMLRDGVTDWLPSFLSESFHISEENAIFAAVIPAIFSMVSFYVFDLLHRKALKNEVFCAAVIFGGSMVFGFGLFFLQGVISSPILSVLLVALIIACMHGINLMLISVVPKRFAKSGRVSTFSGLFNSCTYIGASIALPVFARIAERFGWNMTVLSWGIVALCGALVCLVTSPLWKRFRKEYSDN